MVRLAQAQLAGQSQPPPLPLPDAPILHPIENPKVDIRWMGAALGRYYRIERAERAEGPWSVIADQVTDGQNEFNPAQDRLFGDTDNLTSGKTYCYRVIAQNESGESRPSNRQCVKWVK
jgi:hypothetical protein